MLALIPIVGPLLSLAVLIGAPSVIVPTPFPLSLEGLADLISHGGLANLIFAF